MDDLLFQQWVELLEKRTGISLPESRKTFLLTNLHSRMREVNSPDYQSYFHLVTDGSRGQVEWEVLVDRLTVHETRFFRDMNSLNLIQDKYLAQVVEEKEKPYTVHAWSVGCATGEEPYSLAMLMDYFFLKHPGFYYGVTASDVSRAALQTGRDAIYHERRIKNIPEHIAETYLEKVDDEHVQVRSSLKQKVCFTQINLLDLAQQPSGMLDIILCQNVLIYFKRDLRNLILDHLTTRLKPGGILVLGAGEVFGWTHPELELINFQSTLAFKRRPENDGVK
ncbi:MAG: protein-glutamate O-methyltransferase CheR [Thioalkalispiraceae bacterium]